jgi:hypothetical protein
VSEAASEAPPGTRLFRREPGCWGVPPEKVSLCSYVLAVLRRDFDLGHTVTAVRWFHEADSLTQDGDRDTFRAGAGEAGHVVVAEPDVIWLNRALCDLPDRVLTRILVHEVCHVHQLHRPGAESRTVEDLERQADEATAILTEGLR